MKILWAAKFLISQAEGSIPQMCASFLFLSQKYKTAIVSFIPSYDSAPGCIMKWATPRLQSA